MRKLIMWNVVTLDGCFEGTAPWDLSFHSLVWGPELEQFCIEQLQGADMLVFGENTYQGMARHWTNAETDEPVVAPLMNNIKKIVCSPTLEKAEWNNTTIVRDAVKELAQLKRAGDRPMYVFGSANLSESLMQAGLFDEVRLCVAPIMLGKGRRLFTDKNAAKRLALLEAKPLSNGGVVLKYQVQN